MLKESQGTMIQTWFTFILFTLTCFSMFVSFKHMFWLTYDIYNDLSKCISIFNIKKNQLLTVDSNANALITRAYTTFSVGVRYMSGF